MRRPGGEVGNGGKDLVPVVGLEPTRPFKGPQDFKSCASAISPHRQRFISKHLRKLRLPKIGLVLVIVLAE